MIRMKSDFDRKGLPFTYGSPSPKKTYDILINGNHINHSSSALLYQSQVEGMFKDPSREDYRRYDANNNRLHSSRILEPFHAK